MELSEVKNFLRLDISDDDEFLTSCISAAEEYLKAACGDNVNLESKRAHTAVLMLVGDYYESRSPYGQGKYSQNISSILTQLALETEAADSEVKTE